MKQIHDCQRSRAGAFGAQLFSAALFGFCSGVVFAPQLDLYSLPWILLMAMSLLLYTAAGISLLTRKGCRDA